MENKSKVHTKKTNIPPKSDAFSQTMHLILKILPHAVIVMALMMLVFFCIDQVNEHMGFMTNEFHRWLSMLLSVAALGYAVDAVARTRKAEREAEAKRVRALKEKAKARSAGASPAAKRPQPRPVPAKKAQ